LCVMFLSVSLFTNLSFAKPITLTAKNIKLIAKSAKDIELYTSGDLGSHKVITIYGYWMKWNPKAKTNGGTLKKITVDNKSAIEVNYKLKPGASKEIRIRGRFILDNQQLKILFDVWGVPRKHHFGGSEIGR